jgi:hypothetical protein
LESPRTCREPCASCVRGALTGAMSSRCDSFVIGSFLTQVPTRP